MLYNDTKRETVKISENPFQKSAEIKATKL